MEEEKHPLRKYLNGHEHRVHRNTDDKDHPDRGSDANEKFVISEEKTILVVKCQRPWLNCIQAVVFCGRQNLQTMQLNVWLRTFVSKMLKKKHSSF